MRVCGLDLLDRRRLPDGSDGGGGVGGREENVAIILNTLQKDRVNDFYHLSCFAVANKMGNHLA